MPMNIADTCIKCGACCYECPNGAISEGKLQYAIDTAACTECGACLDIYCPGWAIARD